MIRSWLRSDGPAWDVVEGPCVLVEVAVVDGLDSAVVNEGEVVVVGGDDWVAVGREGAAERLDGDVQGIDAVGESWGVVAVVGDACVAKMAVGVGVDTAVDATVDAAVDTAGMADGEAAVQRQHRGAVEEAH